LNSKEDILKNVSNQTVEAAIDFHSILFPIWMSMSAINCLFTTFFKKSS